MNQVKNHIRDLLFRRRVTRRCVLLWRIFTLEPVVPLFSAVIARFLSCTVLLYDTASLSVRGGLPIPIGSACPRRILTEGFIPPFFRSTLTLVVAASAASPTDWPRKRFASPSSGELRYGRAFPQGSWPRPGWHRPWSAAMTEPYF